MAFLVSKVWGINFAGFWHPKVTIKISFPIKRFIRLCSFQVQRLEEQTSRGLNLERPKFPKIPEQKFNFRIKNLPSSAIPSSKDSKTKLRDLRKCQSKNLSGVVHSSEDSKNKLYRSPTSKDPRSQKYHRKNLICETKVY